MNWTTRGAAAAALALMLMGLTGGPAHAWGKTGHEYVNGAATIALPDNTPLAAFLRANKAFLVAHSSDPDTWRDTQKVSGEGPHHFIDMDAYGTPSAFALLNLPVKRDDADKKYGAAFVEKMGTVDWTIDLWTTRLAEAMRKGDANAVLADAAVLGHYVGDAHVPFHSALNYDGQLSAQKGIHARFEEQLVKQTIRPADMTLQPAENLTDVLAAAREWSGQSLDLTPTVLQADIQARAMAAGNAPPATGPLPTGSDPYNNRPLPKDGSPIPAYYKNNAPYWKTFGMICRPIALARLNAAASHLASVWLTAWNRAGKPDLSKIAPPTPNAPLPVPDPDAM